MIPDLKRYYLMHSAYWCQQLIVLLLRLEKPRKDYAELVAHHIVTLWLIGYVPRFIQGPSLTLFHRWSYLVNMTLMGNAVYMSMDIPDVFLAVSRFDSIPLLHLTARHRYLRFSTICNSLGQS